MGTAVAVFVAVFALVVVLWARGLDDVPRVRASGVSTPPRTTALPATRTVDLPDLGGSVHHRSGNQP
jgi:hypothetical protein